MIEGLAFFLLIGVFAATGIYLYRASVRQSSAKPTIETHLSLSEKTRPNKLAAALRELGIGIGPVPFVLLIIVLSTCIFFALTEAGVENMGLAGLSAAAFPLVTYLLLNEVLGRRAQKFESELAEAIDLINGALRGGLPPRQALLSAAEASPKSVSSEFREIVDRLDMGVPIEHAVKQLGERHDSPFARLFSQSLVSTWQTGTNFSLLLAAIGKIIHERIKLRAQVAAQLSGARYAAIFSGLLPYTLVPIFLWKQPEWLEIIAEHPYGPVAAISALLMQIAGFFWLRHVLRISL